MSETTPKTSPTSADPTTTPASDPTPEARALLAEGLFGNTQVGDPDHVHHDPPLDILAHVQDDHGIDVVDIPEAQEVHDDEHTEGVVESYPTGEYDVRLLVRVQATDPQDAVEKFFDDVLSYGLRGYTYRVTNGEQVWLVLDDEIVSEAEALADAQDPGLADVSEVNGP